METIAIIGAGNMGNSIIGGLIQNGHPANKIWATDVDEEKLAQLQKKFGVQITPDNKQAIQTANVVIFAIKPQIFAKVASDLANSIQAHRPLIISIAAGIREENIQKWIGGKASIVRTMPNTPALIGCGASALFANQYVTPQQHDLAESILRAVGVIVWVEHEREIDTVTAVSGSGPAYFFLIMEAMQKAGVELGLSEETARLLTLQTAFGAARMALESNASLKELRQNVTSPGGTTEKAICVLEENNIHHIFKQAMRAAKERSEELGK